MGSDVAAALAAFEVNDVTVMDALRAECSEEMFDVAKYPAPSLARSRDPDAGTRRAAALEIEALIGAIPSSFALDCVASAHARGGDADAALAFRLRALQHTPRWDSFESARMLHALAEDLVRLGDLTLAANVARHGLRYDPVAPPTRALLASLGAEAPALLLEGLAPLTDEELVRLLVADDFGQTLSDHFARPRRFALACVRRGELGYARQPLWATRKWRRSCTAFGALITRSEGEEKAWNAALLDAVLATTGAREAVTLSRKRSDTRFTDNYNSRMRAAKPVADDPVELRRFLHDWDRPARLFAAALLVLEHHDALAIEYVEKSSALEDALGRPGNFSSGDWAMPKKILARRAGNLSATWVFLD